MVGSTRTSPQKHLIQHRSRNQNNAPKQYGGFGTDARKKHRPQECSARCKSKQYYNELPMHLSAPLESPQECPTTENLERNQKPVISEKVHANDSKRSAHDWKPQADHCTQDDAKRRDDVAEPSHDPNSTKHISIRHNALL
jgi:hypothetical protein